MKGVLISDFNIENFAAYLNNGPEEPSVEMTVAPYGLVSHVLLNRSLACWEGDLDFAVVWSRPEAVLESFRDVLGCAEVKYSDLDRQVDNFVSNVLSVQDRVRVVYVPTWMVSPFHQGHGMLDLSRDGGIARVMMHINLRLLEKFDGASNVIPLHSEKWFQVVGEKSFSPRLWYLAKIPYANEVFKEAARDLKSALRGVDGKTRKLVIVDLDETLWGGVVGDDGWEQIKLGGHSPAGEALVDFQGELKALTRRGILLGIVSKNDEAVALAAIDKHPEMVLRRNDFAGWRINWKDKAANIVDLVNELNLGIDSVVFIDDNPIERARVREALPEVLVPEWPIDHRLYPQALLRLDCFNKASFSDEDRCRRTMYLTQRKRAELKAEAGSLDQWLQTLSISVTVEPLNSKNLARAAQLLNKTNQLNLSTRRMGESQLFQWASEDNRYFWTFRVIDRFGDSGITGLLSVERQHSRARIEDFVLSCRVMGRKVEEMMLYVAIDWAKAAGLEQLCAVYKPTAKNKPCLELFQRSGFHVSGENVFTWDLDSEFPACPNIRLVRHTCVDLTATSA